MIRCGDTASVNNRFKGVSKEVNGLLITKFPTYRASVIS